MSDSDWWCSVVVGGEVPARLAEPAVVKPQHRGEGEQALGDADEHARWRGPAVLLQAELTLEGVDDALDHWRMPPSLPCRRGSSARSGRSTRAPSSPAWRSKSRP